MVRKRPIHLFLNNEQIAGLITYIRNTWDNTGLATEKKFVNRIRKVTLDRRYPWLEAELS